MANATKIVMLKGRLSFAIVSTEPVDTPKEHFYSIEKNPTYVFRGFFADFGPLHLGCVHSFCQLTDRKLQEYTRKELIFYTSPHEHLKANAAFLVGAYVIIRHNFTALDVLRLFIKLRFIPFRDASYGICGFMLSYLDCMRGLEHAIKCGLYDFRTFDLEQYLHLHELKNGDINWILPNKFLAFSGPYDERRPIGPNIYAYGVDDYVPVFKKLGVTCVVRLNKKCYDKRRFTMHGIKVKELVYEDGSCPPPSILRKFLALANKEPCLAVHCKAGLGRTGTCIAVYMMKYLGFTARAIIAWCRICRPGSLLGPQQLYLERHEEELLAEYAKHKALLNKRNASARSSKPPLGTSKAFVRTSKPAFYKPKSSDNKPNDAKPFSKIMLPAFEEKVDAKPAAKILLPVFEEKVAKAAPDTKTATQKTRLTYPTKQTRRNSASNLKSEINKSLGQTTLSKFGESNNVLVPISNKSRK